MHGKLRFPKKSRRERSAAIFTRATESCLHGEYSAAHFALLSRSCKGILSEICYRLKAWPIIKDVKIAFISIFFHSFLIKTPLLPCRPFLVYCTIYTCRFIYRHRLPSQLALVLLLPAWLLGCLPASKRPSRTGSQKPLLTAVLTEMVPHSF